MHLIGEGDGRNEIGNEGGERHFGGGSLGSLGFRAGGRAGLVEESIEEGVRKLGLGGGGSERANVLMEGEDLWTL